jgi:phosphoglycerate dehydrogenase-like enzyme
VQILMTKDAWARVRDRMPALPTGTQIVTAAAPDLFTIDGSPVATQAVRPEAAWLSSDAFLTGLVQPLADRMLASPAARWVQTSSAGVEMPIFRAIMSAGIRLSNSSALASPMAEYVLAHALSMLVPIDAQRATQAKREWRRTPYHEVGATRWLLVGYGAIGQEVARRAKAFGVHLTVMRRAAHSDEMVDRTISRAEMLSVLPEADVVVLACALNDETRGLADAAFFGAMKPGAILINVGRGALVDEVALRAGLDRDQPARAALDVFATEPLPADAWFWDHPQVRVSAHTSGLGDGYETRGATLFLENLGRYLIGKPLLNEVARQELGLTT